jgi:hypothetical protein
LVKLLSLDCKDGNAGVCIVLPPSARMRVGRGVLHSYPSKALLCGSFGSEWDFLRRGSGLMCSEMTQIAGRRRLFGQRSSKFIGSVYEESDSLDGGWGGVFGGAAGCGAGARGIYWTVQGRNLYVCRQQTGGLPRTPGREGVVCGGGSASNDEGSSDSRGAFTRFCSSADCCISEGGSPSSGSCGGSFP